jgi:hypothetical protein
MAGFAAGNTFVGAFGTAAPPKVTTPKPVAPKAPAAPKAPTTYKAQTAAIGFPAPAPPKPPVVKPATNTLQSTIKNLMGSQPPPPVAAPQVPAMPPLVNTTTPSANAQWMVDQVKTQMGNDPTEALINRNTLAAGDEQARVGAGLDSEMARRGITGTGAEGLQRQKLAMQGSSNLTQSNRDIRLDQAEKKKQFLLGSAGIMQNPDQLALQQQGLGLQQWNAQAGQQNAQAQMQQNAQLQQQQMAFQQQQALMQVYSQLYGSMA